MVADKSAPITIGSRSRPRPPASTSSILRRTRSPPLTLLLIAKLNIARSRLRHSQLKPDANGPDILRPQRTLLDDQAPLVPRSRCRQEVGFGDVSEPAPFHLSGDRPGGLLQKALFAPKQPPRTW